MKSYFAYDKYKLGFAEDKSEIEAVLFKSGKNIKIL